MVSADITKPRICRHPTNRDNPTTDSVEQYYRVLISAPFLDHLMNKAKHGSYQMINKTNDRILNLTTENITQHSRKGGTTAHKGSSAPAKMSKIDRSEI